MNKDRIVLLIDCFMLQVLITEINIGVAHISTTLIPVDLPSTQKGR